MIIARPAGPTRQNCPPAALRRRIRSEDYSPAGREGVLQFLALAQQKAFDDPLSTELAGFLRDHRQQIEQMLQRAGALAQALRRRADLPAVTCHTDLHPGNLLLDRQGALYLVDWDAPRLAPKERDLMFLGAGMGEDGPGVREAALFYQGYGPAQVDGMALAYYRYERIIQDIYEFCKQILLTSGESEDRYQAYAWFSGQFLPGREVEAAFGSDCA
jgi:spectinomycin phosphotransferase